MLPGMDGFEVLKHIRQQSSGHRSGKIQWRGGFGIIDRQNRH
jgi:CheY-like chemotaxis protein